MSCSQIQILPTGTVYLVVLRVEKDCGSNSKLDRLRFLETGLLKLRLVSQIPGGKISALSYQDCAGENTKMSAIRHELEMCLIQF